MRHGMLNHATSGQLPISAKIAFTNHSARWDSSYLGGAVVHERVAPAYANEHSLSFLEKDDSSPIHGSAATIHGNPI